MITLLVPRQFIGRWTKY